MSEYIEHDKDANSVGIVEKKLYTFANRREKWCLKAVPDWVP